MPGNYANTSLIVDGARIDAADLKTPIDSLDDKLKLVSDAVDLLIASPVITNSATAAFSGEILLSTALASPPTIGGTTAGIISSSQLILTGAAATNRTFFMRSGAANRFAFLVDNVAESGANAGSNFNIYRYDDAGNFLATALSIIRSSGAVSIPGSLNVTGALSKGSGTFKIPHPLEIPDTWLYHGFIEGARYDLIYRGTAELIKGEAVIDIDLAARMTPGTFAALTQDPQVFLQNETGWEPVRGRVNDPAPGKLKITCKDPESVDLVSWLVIAERADDHIKALEITDTSGRLVPEQPYTAGEIERMPYERPTAEQRAEIDAALKAERPARDGFREDLGNAAMG